ncbi:MAG: hypothetical protein WD397_17315 [Wenzhouxiangellaceae bacterium]
MTQFTAERPAFFEGQYLGAEDLAALVTYFREHDARHLLGAHTWGIVAGLDLAEVEAPDGTLDVLVQPGLAVDGYGRLIVVMAQTRLDAAQFSAADSGEVEVWIRYAQSAREGVRKGFEVCAAEDVFARVSETFALEIGPRSILQRQSGVEVNGADVLDARETLRAIDPEAALIEDASIPYQALPEDADDALWLVPLGHARWQGGAPGSFQPLTDEQRVRSRRKRRYAGVVAESLLAADGVIRLRRRTTEFDAAKGPEIDHQFTEIELQSADFYLCEDELLARELIWLEGDTRITGDARLFGSRLEFRDRDGHDFIQRTVDGFNIPASTALLLQRQEVNVKNGVDLQVLLGESADGRNRLSIGRAVVTGADLCTLDFPGDQQIAHVVFQDDGMVGIGAVDSTLVAPLTLRARGDGQELLALENTNSARIWQFNLRPNEDGDENGLNLIETAPDVSRLHIAVGGNIGLGTDAPAAHLHIQGDDPDLFLDINGDSPNSLTELRFGSGGTHTSSVYWSKASKKIVVNNEGTNSLVIDEEKIGLGTNDPSTTLHIATGSDVTSNDNSGYMVIGRPGEQNLGIDVNEIQARNSNAAAPLYLQLEGGDLRIHPNNNSRFTVKNSGRTGIGTDNPSAKLDVRGDVRLGNNGNLYAPGGVENLRIIVGSVGSNGNTTQGDGFTSTRTGEGRYQINFNDGFPTLPVVVVTLVNHLDSVLSVHGASPGGFEVRAQDVEGALAGTTEDVAFNFIVMGER